jgi:hypothetical protein
VFENRVLRRIFGLKIQEEAQGWRKLCNGEYCNFYSLPDIIEVRKSTSVKRTRLVVWMGK